MTNEKRQSNMKNMALRAYSFLAVLLSLTVSLWANEQVSWPLGKYGLPKTKSGCPDEWKEGWRRQDLDEKTNTSANIRMDVQIENNGNIKRSFCVKNIKDTGTNEWPKGFYCIYKSKDSPCPAGMTQGAVQWDDSDVLNVNDHGGTLPDGVYDLNTKIYYCCQSMGRWFDPISLPIHRPFYLLPHNKSAVPRCQLVNWTISQLEYIDYDTVDLRSIDKFSGDHVFLKQIKSGSILLSSTFWRVYYCYYEGCRYKMNNNEGVFGSSNGNPRFDKCSWSIVVENSHMISMVFTQLQLPKCEESYLAVYDGVDEAAPLLGKYCDSKTPKDPTVSSGNKVFVILKSLTPQKDFSRQPKFQVKYIAERSPSSSFTPKLITKTRFHTEPTEQSSSDNKTSKSNSDNKTAIIISLAVVLIFILVNMVLLVIFRAKVIYFLEKLCYKANGQSQEQTKGRKDEPTTNGSRISTKNINVDDSQWKNENESQNEAELQYVDVVGTGQQNTDDVDSHYTDLQTVGKEPENIYESLQFNRNDIAPVNIQNMDDLYENVA